MAAQKRVTDTVRAVFSGNRTADDTNAISGAGAHAVTGQRADTVDTSRLADDETTIASPVVDRTPTLPNEPVPAATSTPAPAPPVSAPAAAADVDRHRGLGHAERQQVLTAQRARYGGVSWGAAFFGWLSANGMAVLLIALLSAGGLAFGLSDRVGSVDEAADSAASGIGLGAGIALLVALFLAYLAGGYVAGRMARFDGARQGVAVWVIGLVVVVLLALAGLFFGSEYNVFADLDLPRIPVDEGNATTAGIIALVAVLVATLAGAVLGGSLGARYHRKVDRVGFDAV
ncbi:conserved membrane protein of unknown function [Modestobacter italicus]|uniref:Uncharacterized protein n=1 Tax=Modestobacter italicus (strain DSM 44449 / CECT 9708 / BC 501) TaxID=2732864 RepID=I4EQM1_MODI5|nr:hypothetical protein [Modestobacter marinus]CCH85684.1 conserved membrane protein of unknown function [Modestobacter marinus]